jgi:hypothetical protein
VRASSHRFEQPEIVEPPMTGFHHDGARDAVFFSVGPIVSRQRDPMQRVAGLGPGNALSAGGIEEMDVAVNDGAGLSVNCRHARFHSNLLLLATDFRSGCDA